MENITTPDYGGLQQVVSEQGVQAYLDNNIKGAKFVSFDNSDGRKFALVDRGDGSFTSLDTANVKSWIHTESARRERVAESTNHLATFEKDLSDIGIDDYMVRTGKIDEKLEQRLARSGYPLQRIQADLAKLRGVKYPHLVNEEKQPKLSASLFAGRKR